MAGIVGIDYGSKLAGTTVLCFYDGVDSTIRFFQSQKKTCADTFVLNTLGQLHTLIIGMDAPLSLPGVYSGIEGYNDYHYRKCDIEAKAMSPMFLGGLTARAMKLKSQISCEVIEVYPKQVAIHYGLIEFGYKSENQAIPTCLEILFKENNFPFLIPSCENWHQFDALLAMIACYRYQNNQATSLGEQKEGMIYF